MKQVMRSHWRQQVGGLEVVVLPAGERDIRHFSDIGEAVTMYLELNIFKADQPPQAETFPPLLIDVEVVLAEGVGEVLVGVDLVTRHVEVRDFGREAVLGCTGEEPGRLVAWAEREVGRHCIGPSFGVGFGGPGAGVGELVAGE